jgi:homoserine dehydrogenase
LVPGDHILSSVNGAFNSISVFGKFMGPANLHGLGAGPGPSAVGVTGDVIEAARYILTGQQRPISPFSMPLEKWNPIDMVPMGRIRSEYYLRFNVLDRLGVLSAISKVLAGNRISVRSVIQKGLPSDSGTEAPVDIVIITHEAMEADVQTALEEINQQPFIAGRTQLIRIEAEERKTTSYP